ncbi:hypothetical protein VFPBJ_01519 [Purpureocillium lilacinum]|uniref:Uncharacterized protein n=1 Tax=Purpureocillium lilacinum TaxID=33203 RepID=A0A179HDD1_PURLI|nr:hypothetical protein VFPBJ_01519 [Purpureocillium lilacinum]
MNSFSKHRPCPWHNSRQQGRPKSVFAEITGARAESDRPPSRRARHTRQATCTDHAARSPAPERGREGMHR